MRNLKILIVICIVGVCILQCKRVEDINNKTIKRKITEMSFLMGGASEKSVHKFEYDEDGQLIKVLFNDSLYIEVVSRETNLIRYQCYFPDPTFIEPPVLVEISLNNDKKILDITNFNDFFSSTYTDEGLPERIGIPPTLSAYIPQMVAGSVVGNYSENFVFDRDSILFDYLFYQLPNWPSSWESEEVLSDARWYYYGIKSPAILPMQDIAFLGGWANINASILLQSLLYVLNISGYSTYISDYLVKEKSYTNASTDRFYFNYEFDVDGYVTRMYVRNGSSNPVWDTFEFTYSE